MYQIISKKILAQDIIEYTIFAPDVASRANPGQFVILRTEPDGERLPFTICDFDRRAGTVVMLVQTVGASTYILSQKENGSYISDFLGPLGNATDLLMYNKILLVSGGIGIAVTYPQAKLLHEHSKSFEMIIGARNYDLLIYKEEVKRITDSVHFTTDDGSFGFKGFVTDKVRELLSNENSKFDIIFAVGPLPMMRAVFNVAREFSVNTIISMNSIMLDGTGMCGCCRLTVNGKIKYACVDGPEFDANGIDWNETINRSKRFKEIEAEHYCKVRGLC
ncbi:MAG: sulfide/dihydroorotate dehydrogenase-like FAD/NAD-binding protein [Christensenellaceae bacterium]|jgi:ferredoxin--NADP+ reductase|nr:sulfide/dihydroorotate dehydrogenase-like FAD/NAD-binding protein [Christensenellaceae bacterium]